MLVKIYGYQNETGKVVNYNENLIKDEGNGCALEVTVEIPEKLHPYESVSGDTCIDVDGMRMSLNEMLFCDKNGNPCIKYPDMVKMKDTTKRLKVISENGWKNTFETL